MPLYIARWGDLSISIVQARDRKELFDRLDEIGDPYGCAIKEYRGPFHIALELDANYASESVQPGLKPGIVMKDVSNCREGHKFRWIEQHGGTGSEMYEEIVKFAFPHYASYLDVCGYGQTDLTEADRDKLCKESLKQDLEWYETYPWKQHDRPGP
jgi:hypothetical protein